IPEPIRVGPALGAGHHRPKEALAMKSEREHGAVGDEPRIGDLDGRVGHVAVVEGEEFATVPAIDGLDAHRVKAMPRLLRFPLGRWVDPAAAYLALLGGETDVVWLDSGPAAESGRSYLGRASRAALTGTTGSVLEFLRTELADSRVEPSGEGVAPGWVGWIGY